MDVVISWSLRKRKNLGGGEAVFNIKGMVDENFSFRLCHSICSREVRKRAQGKQ